MRYTRSGIGLLNAQYRSVLKKCFLINLGLFALGAGAANAEDYSLKAEDLSTSKNITWKEISADKYKSDNPNMLKVELSAGKAQYFEYTYTKPEGGTVYNERKEGKEGALTGDITADFKDSISNVDGGALSNAAGNTLNISGDFLNNQIDNTGSGNDGGAIYNLGTISINGDMINNHIVRNGDVYGGAIYNVSNNANITEIIGNYIGNYLVSNSSHAYGGAIFNYNKAEIGKIEGKFIGNCAIGNLGENNILGAGGGAIVNLGSTIKSITGEFINNYTQNASGHSGGAIVNSGANGVIGSIEAVFINNYSTSLDGRVRGGAIFNSTDSHIGDIKGKFSGNHLWSKTESGGGAVLNIKATMDNIYADFTNNYVYSEGCSYGGALANLKSVDTYDGEIRIKDVVGNFINNYAEAKNSWSEGGAIYNSSAKMENITGNFINNYAEAKNSYALGGAIYNESATIKNITGYFTGNYVKSVDGDVRSGAIYNQYAKMGDITADFTGNYALSETNMSNGGAVVNLMSTINKIKGNFTNNYALSGGRASGGAVNNSSGIIGSITGDFDGNYAESNGGVAAARGGALLSFGDITNLTANFSNNHALTNGTFAIGGAVANMFDSSLQHGITTLSGNFSNNFAQTTGAGDEAYAQGGAIYNSGTIGNITGDFIGNYASVETGIAQGGAIYNSGTITIAGASTFTDNYVEKNGEKTSNAIHNEGTINFNGTNIVVNDAITGKNGTINIASSSNGMTTFNNSVSGNTINLKQGTLKLGHYTSEKFGDSEGSFADDVDFVANGGVLNLGDQKVSLKSAEFNDGSTLAINIKSDGNGLLKAENLTINGGQLKASLGQGVVDMQNKQKIVTLLESGTEFTNNFSDVTDNNMYRFEKSEKAGDYIISLAKTAAEVSKENGGTQNNAETAKGWVDGNKFEQGSVSAGIADKLADLAQNDAKGFNEALSALAPDDTPEVRTNSVNHNTEMFRAVVSHLDDVSKKSQYGLSSGDVVDGVSVWAKAFGNHAKVDNTSKAYGFKSDGYGATLGIEKQLNNAFKVGLGYSYFYNDVDGFMRDSDVNTHTGFVYGEYRPNNWYTNAIASYGYSEYDENKHVAGDVYKAKYDVDNIGAQVMTGYNASVAKVDVTPEAGLRYNNIHRDNYVDSAGQAVKAETMDVLTAVAGLKVGKDLVSCFGLHEVYWRPEARLAATYDLISDKENAVVSLSNGSGYVVKGQRLNRFGIEAGADVTFYLSPDVESSVGYEGKFRKDYQDHTGYVSAKYKF